MTAFPVLDLEGIGRPSLVPFRVTEAGLNLAVRRWMLGADLTVVRAMLGVDKDDMEAIVADQHWQERAYRMVPYLEAATKGAMLRVENLSLEQLIDRVEKGDIAVVAGTAVMKDDGTFLRRPMKAKDLVEVLGKVNEIRNDLEFKLGKLREKDKDDAISLDKLIVALQKSAREGRGRDVTAESSRAD